MKPEFIDNFDGNTLAIALQKHLDWLTETYAKPVELSIATGYFNPGGFAHIANHLDGVSHIRLLLGAEPLAPPKIPRRNPEKDPRGSAFEQKILNNALLDNEKGIRDDRNLLEFTQQIDATVQRLLDFLASGKVEVRRYEKGFLHGKAFVFSTDEGAIAGSSNFTAAGLTTNLELNLGHYQPGLVSQVKGWFDRLWDNATAYDLSAIYAERYAEYDPYLIYLRVLWELYHNELEGEREVSGRIPLTTFQTDGIDRADRILKRYNGVVIADGVGLGKTFIAGEMMRLIQENRQRVLLISPAALRDGTWERFQKRTQLRFENISYEELVNEKYDFDPAEYELIVIDEAQAFRNPSTQRAHALRLLLRGKPPKKLVLISATPVNNSLWDLYYLLTYFVKHDAVFADRGIRSLKERFSDAQKLNPFDLRPDTLFDVLDPVTVRRTRQFVKKWYPGDRFAGPDGTEMIVRFPTPHVQKVNYDLDEVLPEGFFDEFAQALAPEEGPPKLSMARYCSSAYRLEGESDHSEVALEGLIRSAVLKRFESSAYAFTRTVERLVDSHNKFLDALDAGYVPSPEAITEMGEVDSDESLEELLVERGSEPVENYRIDELQTAVAKDRDLLLSYAEVGRSITPEHSPKLRNLADALVEIIRYAKRDSDEGAPDQNKVKVLIFSYYADTVEWIFNYLRDRIEIDKRLMPYRGRIAGIMGNRTLHGDTREATIWGFAPVSTEAPPRHSENRFDVLITTDVLAEGMNLQQCCHIINFDLPWNPMRLVQRQGRIDRIGSPHSDVFIRCFFPDKRLDELLILEHRIRNKLAQAAASIGIESEVIPGAITGEIVFAETREEIEALHRENADIFQCAGEPEGVHSGEEYRQELRKGLEEWEVEIKDLPWGAGSGFSNGKNSGWFFCARIADKVFLRFVPLSSDKGLVSDTLGCLRVISCDRQTSRHISQRMASRAYAAWELAREHIFNEWMAAADPKNLQPKIRPLFREAAEHLRQNPPTGIDQKLLEESIDALLAPWGIRYEREFREILRTEDFDAMTTSQLIVDKVKELGMEPYATLEPLPVIDKDEIALICWMAVVE